MSKRNRKRLTVGPVSVKHPLLKARILFTGFGLLCVLFLLGGTVFIVPGLLLTTEYGDVGWLLAGVAVVGSVVAMSYHGYRKTLKENFSNSREITRESSPEMVALLEFVEHECSKRGMETPSLYVHPAGAVNAFAIGRRNDGHIFLMDGALAAFDEKELEAIVAHELAHIDNHDSVLMAVLIGVRRTIVEFWTWVAYMLRVSAYERRGAVFTRAEKRMIRRDTRGWTRYLAAPLTFLEKSISRRREYIADAEAAEMTNTENVIGALEALSEANHDSVDHEVSSSLCIVSEVEGFLGQVRSTHPPVENRVSRVKQVYGDKTTQ